MRAADFSRLKIFVAVAERGSFVKAADALGLSTSTVSQAVRGLEESLGVRLLNRTTRSVALTEAGDTFLDGVRGALDGLDEAVEALNAYREQPAGTLRLSVSSLALSMVLTPALPSFHAAYPDITLDIVVDNDSGDLLEGRMDAGIRGATQIPQDMIAVRIGAASRIVAVASPDYLARNGRPLTPADLRDHNCIMFRYPTGATYRWVFEDGGRRIDTALSGSLLTDNMDLILKSAVDGIGIGYTVESHAAAYLDSGELAVVLDAFSPAFPGWFIYHTSRRQLPVRLKALIDFLTLRLGSGGGHGRGLARVVGAAEAGASGNTVTGPAFPL